MKFILLIAIIICIFAFLKILNKCHKRKSLKRKQKKAMVILQREEAAMAILTEEVTVARTGEAVTDARLKIVNTPITYKQLLTRDE